MSYMGKVRPTIALTSDDIEDGAILNVDVNASAAIANSKMATDTTNATNLASGTVPTARLGSGSASSSTFLRGDQTYAEVATGTAWQSVVSGTTLTAVAGRGYPIDTTSNVCTVTLPAGSVGDVIEIVDYAGTADTNRITLTADGSEKINGSTEDHTIIKEREGIRIVYVDATQGWIAATAANEGTKALGSGADVEYLVVGGGGGGGTGTTGAGYARGGGGAGGYRTNFGGVDIVFTSGQTYTATVGTGGAGSTVGVDSTLSGSDITNITSTGGGAGSETSGSDGGSGGGGADSASGGSGNTPSTSPSQGYDGGDSSQTNATGGGGGASEVGESNGVDGTGGDGGAGTANEITGASVTYAGGGGGGGNLTSGAGGAGGGGVGFKYNSNSGQEAPGDGTDGLGGGGGGGGCSSCGFGGAGGTGGDGVIILRLLTVNYSGTTTGSPTVTTDGSYTVIKFTGTGTYTQ